MYRRPKAQKYVLREKLARKILRRLKELDDTKLSLRWSRWRKVRLYYWEFELREDAYYRGDYEDLLEVLTLVNVKIWASYKNEVPPPSEKISDISEETYLGLSERLQAYFNTYRWYYDTWHLKIKPNKRYSFRFPYLFKAVLKVPKQDDIYFSREVTSESTVLSRKLYDSRLFEKTLARRRWNIPSHKAYNRTKVKAETIKIIREETYED